MRREFPQVYMEMARTLAAGRALCRERQVSCILVDADNKMLAMGYNGRPTGASNCIGTTVCEGRCEGLHAEINALLRADPLDVHYAVVTCAPCWHCIKALLATPCRGIFYARSEPVDEDQHAALALWLKHGRYSEAI